MMIGKCREEGGKETAEEPQEHFLLCSRWCRHLLRSETRLRTWKHILDIRLLDDVSVLPSSAMLSNHAGQNLSSSQILARK